MVIFYFSVKKSCSIIISNIHYACNNWFEGLFNLIFKEIINSLTDCGWTLYDKEDETEMMDLDLEEMFRKTTLWFNF